MNRLTVIGYLSNKYCYLNLDHDTCVKRYCESENISIEDFGNDKDINSQTFDFKDEFCAYDAYDNDK